MILCSCRTETCGKQRQPCIIICLLFLRSFIAIFFVMGENMEYGVSFIWKGILSYISKIVHKVEGKGRTFKVCFHTLLPYAHHLDEIILNFVFWVNICTSHELFWKFTLNQLRKCLFLRREKQNNISVPFLKKKTKLKRDLGSKFTRNNRLIDCNVFVRQAFVTVIH